MQVTKDKVVSFDFEVTDHQGVVLDSSKRAGPIPYIHGNGYLIPGLEEAMEGRIAQDSFAVSVPPSKAYGERMDHLIQAIPRENFQGIDLEVGMQLEAQSPQGSTLITVKDFDENNVTIDRNHPLAGQTINFDITIVDVRDATPDELQHGHPMTGGACSCDDDACGSCEGC